MLEGFSEALVQLLTLQSLGLVLVGLGVGTAAAILPGVSPGTMMALLLPLTFTMDKYHAFMFLVALMASAGFAGSMTSILLNVPGDGINAATCLDGYPLARQGKAGVAIGASATASGLGMICGIGFLILSLPVIGGLILAFGPPEFFALSTLGISMIAAVSTRSPVKGLLAGLLGMLFGFIGDNPIVGGTRYTFGVLELADGIALAPALIGLFALPELYDLMRTNQTISRAGMAVKGGVWQGVLEVVRRPVLFFRSAALGTLMGLMPGVGQSVASWVSYYAALNSSRDPSSFGKGNVEGVIAPEATIDAKEAASMLPVLAFGLPGGVTSAILLSAFQIQGVVPGQRLLQSDSALVWVMILTMLFCSLSTSVMGFLFSTTMVKITLVPVALLVPVIYILGLIGSYAEQNSLFGIVLAVGFGFLGLAMEKLGYPRAPLLVGMILVPLAEKNFFQSLQLNRGSYDFLLRPITLGIFILMIAAIAFPRLRGWWMTRRDRPQRREHATNPLTTSVAARVPVGELAFGLFLLAVALVFLIQSFTFPLAARRFPQIVLAIMLLLLLYHFGPEIVRAARRGVRLYAAGEAPEGGGNRDVLVALGWLLLLPGLMWVAGLLVGGVLYTVAMSWGFAGSGSRRRLVRGLLTAAVMVGLTYSVFERGLGLQLYGGFLG